MAQMIEQTKFPLFGTWIYPGVGDYDGYEKPDRSDPALVGGASNGASVSVIGTVKNERVAWDRSWAVWSKQDVDKSRVVYHVLDDGSTDKILDSVKSAADDGHNIVYSRWRSKKDQSNRSCTLVFNAAIKQLVTTPLVVIQWWDRIPGSFTHLRELIKPHFKSGEPGVVTSAVSRHIGASSSVDTMTPDALTAVMQMVDWKNNPELLASICGPIGSHCVPGNSSESSGLCIPVNEFNALGGFDERYYTRASYVNVEFFRRVLQSGLACKFVAEPDGANYHQSHACPTNRQKDRGFLSDPLVKRNQGVDWGTMEPLQVWRS